MESIYTTIVVNSNVERSSLSCALELDPVAFGICNSCEQNFLSPILTTYTYI